MVVRYRWSELKFLQHSVNDRPNPSFQGCCEAHVLSALFFVLSNKTKFTTSLLPRNEPDKLPLPLTSRFFLTTEY